jgi:hypothetical protein
MTYAAAPPAPPAAPSAPRRPVTVSLAAGLLAVMGLVGLGYAVTTLAVTPGVVDRFRDAAAGGDVDGYVTGVWMLATIGAVLAVVLFALYIVLALGLRRGARGFRTATWVVCGLGLLFGCGSAATVGAQRVGDGVPGTPGYELSAAYPGSWIEINVALALAQALGYAIVAGLLMGSGDFFRRTGEATSRSQAYVALPTYGVQQAYPAAPAAPAQPAVGPAHPAAPAFPSDPGFPSAPAVSPEDHAAWSRPEPTVVQPTPPTEGPTDGSGGGDSAHQSS